MDKLIKLINKARFVFVCGNGGSATTAEHFTNDLFSQGIRAICLNSNTAIMTMLANDFGYEKVFSKQLALLGTKKDFLITISCSGTSPNILEVQELAIAIGMPVYQFATFKEDRDYGELENLHLEFAHEVASKL